MKAIMETRRSHFGGNFVAECPQCHTVCVYWDDEDLNEDGHLECGNCNALEFFQKGE